MNVYGDYTSKKVFFSHMNKTEYPGNSIVHKDCEIGYNEMRRVVYHQKFGFYDGAYDEMLYCLTVHAYRVETMVKELTKAKGINNETLKGVVQCIQAKRTRRA